MTILRWFLVHISPEHGDILKRKLSLVQYFFNYLKIWLWHIIMGQTLSAIIISLFQICYNCQDYFKELYISVISMSSQHLNVYCTGSVLLLHIFIFYFKLQTPIFTKIVFDSQRFTTTRVIRVTRGVTWLCKKTLRIFANRIQSKWTHLYMLSSYPQTLNKCAEALI